MAPQLFHTKNSGEMISVLPIQAPGQTVLSLKLNGIRTGDVIHAIAYCEVSNRIGYNVFVGYNLQLAKGPSPSDKIAEITEHRGMNVNPVIHHFEPYDGGYHEFISDMDEVYVNFVLNSLSDDPKRKPGDSLKVEKDYGKLTVALWGKRDA